MPRPGIELMLVQLHLLEGPLFRALNKLSYHGLCKDSNNSVLEPRMHFLNVPHLLVRVFSKESLKIFKTEIFWHKKNCVMTFVAASTFLNLTSAASSTNKGLKIAFDEEGETVQR